MKDRGMIKSMSDSGQSHTLAYLNEKVREIEARLAEKHRECDELQRRYSMLQAVSSGSSKVNNS